MDPLSYRCQGSGQGRSFQFPLHSTLSAPAQATTALNTGRPNFYSFSFRFGYSTKSNIDKNIGYSISPAKKATASFIVAAGLFSAGQGLAWRAPTPAPARRTLSTTVNQASRKDWAIKLPNYLTLPNRIHTAALSLMQTPAPFDLAFSRHRYFTLVCVHHPFCKYLKLSFQLPTHGASGNRPPVSDSSSQSASASPSITAHWHWWGKLLAAAIAQ
ncbi:hypothetical protein CSIM01_08841 [Colletotrichum simmondsii]|uniref:Uncharacterized protein n=1 Tax=Colletotrichum simmondsii TaxID=703756 RepID=A0A135TZK2_9PEZI|nr:hypothetical protein CSIM01_08841 [Colletotrichum simmondsii]